MNARTFRELRRHVLIYAGLAPFAVIAAFKQDADLPPTLEHFHLLFTKTYFTTWLLNTTLLAVCLVAITLVTAVPAAYALARMQLPGAGNVGIALFMTYLVPPIILFLPLARVVGTLGLFDSWWALVVVYPTFTIPFCTWFLIGDIYYWGSLMAAALIVGLPIALLYNAFLDHFIRGLTASGSS